VQGGRSDRGLAALASALELASGPAAGRVLVRRAINLWILGRHAEALDDLRHALRLLGPEPDVRWQGRALTTRALVHLAVGSTRRAELDLRRAARLYDATSQEVDVALIWHNRGLVAFRSGDLPVALSHLDEAGRRYRLLGVFLPDLCIHRCAVLLAAGLPADALAEADAGVTRFPAGGKPTTRAELLLCAAQAALAAGEPQVTVARAAAALGMFATQGRTWWHAHARLLLLQARGATAPPSGRLLAEASQVAATLERLGSDDAPQARLLAGRFALAIGRGADADRHLALAARVRHRHAPALVRAHGWLAEALRKNAAGDRRGLFAACRRGFAVLDEHQFTLGASELRAQATARGAELAALAQRAALECGRPRTLLVWSERWRATAQAIPRARPVDDAALQADLTALRDATSRLERARADGDSPGGLQREQRRLEAAIRDRLLRSPGRGGAASYRFDPGRLLAELGGATLVQIVDIDGVLHLLICGRGRIRHLTAGRSADAAREIGFARLGLRRMAYGPLGGGESGRLAVLAASGERLESVLLGAARRHLGDGPVIIVPPGRLHAVPWSLLPALRDREVSVAPSARAWLAARAAPVPPPGDPVLVLGPGLGAAGAEVATLASQYPGATVLTGRAATARRVLAALAGAPCAHIAAHGTFRSDSPLFSSLRLADGPLTVHDLERLPSSPYRMILPSCDSGVLAAAGADELLGLAAALAPLGTAGIVASVVPVNDEATAGLMLALHRELRAGGTLAHALASARRWAGDDPVRTVTAWSFIALGAG
jgi:hypothetical protein